MASTNDDIDAMPNEAVFSYGPLTEYDTNMIRATMNQLIDMAGDDVPLLFSLAKNMFPTPNVETYDNPEDDPQVQYIRQLVGLRKREVRG